MGPRIARSSVPHSNKRQAGKKSRKRHLDAFAIAGKLAPEANKIRKHRFGEVEEERAKSKRTRDESDEGDEESAEIDRFKRRRQDNGDDDVEYGSDSEGNEWVIGEVDADDDESLDSDEAFGESDEERFEGFTFRGSSTTTASKKQKSSQSRTEDMDLNEEAEQSEEDDFGEEGVDLATMLDDDNEASLDDGDEADSESEEADEELSEGDEDEDEKHARLQDFVEGLDSSTKSRSQPAATADTLTLEDLLEDAGLDNKTLATLKPKKKSAAAAATLVKSNLPKRQQDTIDRKVAAAKAKEQLDRWQDSVIHNRRSDFLSFPLRDRDQAEPTNRDTFVPAQHSKPATDLESNIRQIMEESGMIAKELGEEDIDDGLLKAEAMEANKLPVEEVLRRRAELRRMRILLDREEIKAKRIAKIKSKAYRRVHRKERERLADKERMLLDPEAYANGELNQDEQEEADRRRAHARMNAKHKDSKWARSLRITDRATWDDDARAGVVEQARRQEELKRRIAGREDVDESGDAESGDDDESTSEKEALLRLQRPDVSEKKGLAALAFMQKAENRRKAENDAAVASLQRELDSDAEDQSGIEDDGLGRAIFGPKREVAITDKPEIRRNALEEGHASDEDDMILLDNDDAMAPVDEPQKLVKTKPQAHKASGPLSKAAAKPALDEPVTSASTSAWLTAPKGKKSKLDRKLTRDNDNEAVINTNFDDAEPSPAGVSEATISAKDKKLNNTDSWTTVSYAQDEPESGPSEQPLLSKSERNAAFHARAFAGDDVAVQFAAEKDELIASEDEKETSSHMPGWGSWAGTGLSKAAKRQAERARHNPLYKTKTNGTRPQDRKDAKLENVIISEKSDRKGKKYLAPILPHQFERKEEYERSLRMPLGPEWTTKEVFQKNTRPRVVVRPGTIIEPMSRPLV